jgi:CRP-like cAMP-binding protein
MICCDVPMPKLFPRHGTSVLDRHNSEEDSALMRRSALFAGLSPQECKEILFYARIRNLARNEKLFSQDQRIDKLHMIRSGGVKLTQLSPDGREVILWINGPGDAVGMHADAVGCNHSCSAQAIESCQIFFWEYSLHQLLINRYPQIQINLGRILSSRLRELEERFREVASERVPKRLALLLLRLLRSVGKENRDGVDLGLTREDLAQMTGTTIFTISRVLSKWADFGFVVSRRGGVVICDPDRLRCLAG